MDALPWMVAKMGQFTESKHKRGNPKNAGQFSSTGGGGKKGKPVTPYKVKPEKGKKQPPALPYRVGAERGISKPHAGAAHARGVFGDASERQKPTPPPLPGSTYQVSQPHHQTQQAAVQAGNAALQEVASGIQNGPAKQVFAKALHAHYDEGMKAIQQMVKQKYGDSPQGKQALQQAQQQFIGKILAAWAKVNQTQGAQSSQPNQQPSPATTASKSQPGSQGPAQLAAAAIANKQTSIAPASPAKETSSGQDVAGGHNVKLPANRKKLKIAQANEALKQMGYGRSEPHFNLKHKLTFFDVTKPDGSKTRMSADQVKEIIYRGSATKGNPKKKFIGDSLVAKSFDAFDFSVELADDIPAWLRKRT